MNDKVFHFGGGALGRGLVVTLLYESGKQVILVDTCEEMILQLKNTKSYTVDISDDRKQRFHEIKLEDVISSITEYEKLMQVLQEVDTVTTSVRRENLIYIARTLVEAWGTYDCKSKCVICCENVENVGSYFKKLLSEATSSEIEKAYIQEIQCPDTIVDRICATSGENAMQITSELFHECCVDKNTLENTNIKYITSVDNIEGHFYRKRYLLNAYADSISFLAKEKGLSFLYEAAQSNKINELVSPYITLLFTLLDKRYSICEEESKEWFATYKNRLSNQEIPRELSTVARNLWAKLTLDERFVSPLIELKKLGIDVTQGLQFVAKLIESERNGEDYTSFWQNSLAKLKQCWGVNDYGKQLYQELFNLKLNESENTL
ncbi:MAG: mannitol dehydrogenase [Longicatena sp.]